MKIYLKTIIIVNRAPFEDFRQDFEESGMTVLMGINGKGKTTILSYIADAFYELAKKGFSLEFSGRENSFYRISSSSQSLNSRSPSIVYLRFMGDFAIDYIDFRGELVNQKYDDFITLENKIPYSSFVSKTTSLNVNSFGKAISSNVSEDVARKLFSDNIITYFPSYRYDSPGYLNDLYKITLSADHSARFAGRMLNPVEVTDNLLKVSEWLLDLVLDNQYLNVGLSDLSNIINSLNLSTTIRTDKLSSLINSIISRALGNKSQTFQNVNKILSKALSGKGYEELRFGIAKRNSGAIRIQIVDNKTQHMIIPSIFNLSAGESSLLTLFCELIRQADRNKVDISLPEISGIVVIDEIEKNLHIKLQKEVLPDMFALFPNVQFITSSHSAFFQLGLADKYPDRTTIIDLGTGLVADPISNELFVEVYQMMISENDRILESYNKLRQLLRESKEPIIITEGQTDWKHMKAALSQFKEDPKLSEDYKDLKFKFFEHESTHIQNSNAVNMGWSQLYTMCKSYSMLDNKRKLIFIADRDVDEANKKFSQSDCQFKSWGNNVFSFIIPIPDHRTATPNICIEHYYTDEDLKTVIEVEGVQRRLFVGNEFNEKGYSIGMGEKFYCEDKKKCGENKFSIIDGSDNKRVYKIAEMSAQEDPENYALTKSAFANAVLNKETGFSRANFQHFSLVFNIIKAIIAET